MRVLYDEFRTTHKADLPGFLRRNLQFLVVGLVISGMIIALIVLNASQEEKINNVEHKVTQIVTKVVVIEKGVRRRGPEKPKTNPPVRLPSGEPVPAIPTLPELPIKPPELPPIKLPELTA